MISSSFAACEIVEERYAICLCPHADVAGAGKRLVLHFEEFSAVEKDREHFTYELDPQRLHLPLGTLVSTVAKHAAFDLASSGELPLGD